MQHNSSEPRETPQRKRGCGFGCLITALIIVVLIAVAVFGAGRLLFSTLLEEFGSEEFKWSSSSGSGKLRQVGVDELPNLREVWSSGSGASTTKVARIFLRGVITEATTGWNSESDGSAGAALRAIRVARRDREVRALLLEIDSPGGGVTLSDQLYHELKRFRQSDEGRVIVALLGDLCASGGYYAALAADRIVAHPTTVTGSIGVMIPSYNINELAERLGIRDVSLTSGENKQMLNPFHEISPSQTNLMQQVVNGLHQRFAGLVAENRKLSPEQVRELADGRLFLSDTALQVGLIDRIGYREAALDELATLLESDTFKLIRYEEESGFIDLFRRSRLPAYGGLRQLLQQEAPRLRYEWRY